MSSARSVSPSSAQISAQRASTGNAAMSSIGPPKSLAASCSKPARASSPRPLIASR